MSDADDSQVKMFFLAGEHETEMLGAALGEASAMDGLIYLQGDLGAGKTTLSRGLLRGVGFTGSVKSPTYTLVESYALDDWQVHHFDLYRLADAEELEYMGMRDFFTEKSLCLIEWAEKGAGFLPAPDLLVNLQSAADGREAIVSAKTPKGRVMLSRLSVPSIAMTETSQTAH